jgi:hypothetical protein
MWWYSTVTLIGFLAKEFGTRKSLFWYFPDSVVSTYRTAIDSLAEQLKNNRFLFRVAVENSKHNTSSAFLVVFIEISLLVLLLILLLVLLPLLLVVIDAVTTHICIGNILKW